ncbi:MAG: hypothetical protein RL204_2156 [Bacteroidota bacterium]|jgi:hypothetical protein
MKFPSFVMLLYVFLFAFACEPPQTNGFSQRPEVVSVENQAHSIDTFSVLPVQNEAHSMDTISVFPKEVPIVNEALSIDTFSAFPDEIDGCACYFSNNAEELAKHSYIYANNYGEISFLKINGVMMRFVQYDFQEISATSSIAKYRYGNYELKVVANDGERNGDESWLKSGTIELSNNKGEKLIRSFYGECGC